MLLLVGVVLLAGVSAATSPCAADCTILLQHGSHGGLEITCFLLLQAAHQHPYVVKPSAGRMGSWVACGALAAVVGFCCINPDGGDYGVWIPQVRGRNCNLVSSCAAAASLTGLLRGVLASNTL
jgi:hypothetical protein